MTMTHFVSLARRWRVILPLALSFVPLILMTGCARHETALPLVAIPEEFHKILVAGFEDVTRGGGDMPNVRCPLSGRMFTGISVEPEAEAFFSSRLATLVEERKDPRFSVAERASERLMILERDALGHAGGDERRVLTELGRRAGADAVLIGHIYRFVERVGGEYGVSRPASVAFDLHLVAVRDGRILWTANFDETQHTLMEDLFEMDRFLDRDGRWITAREMAETGLRQLMDSLKRP